MTERRQINHVARKNLAPFGRWERFESAIGEGWPDHYYVLRRVSGWCESKLIPATGVCPPEFTRDQLLWGEAEVRAGGRWHLLGLREGARLREWWLLNAVQARAWFEGLPFEPTVRASGTFPTKAILDALAPLRSRSELDLEHGT